ncbi:plasma-membrane choline transporter-domain-containing protein [Cantharellus anzutake]|uniref:plasma-membrane choline transporter-domain-containing protein n=1 Tax=Cantharellus anzutake TaxID=1750568 RepID=UPI001907EC79|nr:plasma-membrane choline transporter-domain-containing protein [Cantharellus anzutake]KAF8335887.1 plasma-membrane choline transporter-domain-containing protein [Cantharellus anzutake]
MSKTQRSPDQTYPLGSPPQYNIQQSGPYAPNVHPPPGPPPQSQYRDIRRFEPKKRLNDPFFFFFFIAQFLGYCALSGYAIHDWIKRGGLGGGPDGSDTGTRFSLNQHTAYLLLLVSAAALLLSSFFLGLVRAFTRTIMHITLILNIALNIGFCAYLWYMVSKHLDYSGAIVFTVIALISIISYTTFRSRIPLASLLLQIVMDIAKHHVSVYAVAFGALFIQALLCVWFVFTTMATYVKWSPGNPSCANGTPCSSGTVAGLVFFETFSFLWTSEVVSNVAVATLAGGPFGAWYYFGPQGAYDGGMPSHPTLSSLGRACSYSLGSIAFGSLIVTLLDILRLVLQTIRNTANAEGHPVEACLAACAECFVGCVEALVEYFNRYAYIQIALYGKPYMVAAKDTWRVFQDRGIDALINDSIIGITMMWGAYGVGILSGIFSYIYLRYTKPSYNSDGQYTPVVMFFAFIIGVQCCLTTISAIEAGVSTIFVGLGEDPAVLATRAPELFEMIAAKYPKVVQGVHGF